MLRASGWFSAGPAPACRVPHLRGKRNLSPRLRARDGASRVCCGQENTRQAERHVENRNDLCPLKTVAQVNASVLKQKVGVDSFPTSVFWNGHDEATEEE